MMSNLERLVYMANQIARNFEAIGHDAAAAATADHIASFWDPRMKQQIFALIDGGDADLSATARTALLSLRYNGAPEPQTRATEFNAATEAGHADAG
jgi:formate dehydrogenase subunit delta